jgi:hypothetical protein
MGFILFLILFPSFSFFLAYLSVPSLLPNFIDSNIIFQTALFICKESFVVVFFFGKEKKQGKMVKRVCSVKRTYTTSGKKKERGG